MLCLLNSIWSLTAVVTHEYRLSKFHSFSTKIHLSSGRRLSPTQWQHSFDDSYCDCFERWVYQLRSIRHSYDFTSELRICVFIGGRMLPSRWMCMVEAEAWLFERIVWCEHFDLFHKNKTHPAQSIRCRAKIDVNWKAKEERLIRRKRGG
jgi:hypothetical protein